MVKKFFILLFFAFGELCSMLPTDDEYEKQPRVNQLRKLRFKYNESVFGSDKIKHTDDIFSVSLYFAQNIQKYIKPEFTVNFLEKKVLQPYAEGTVEMSIAGVSSSSSSSSNSVALDVMTLSKFENIFLPTSELQNLRNAIHNRYDLQVKVIDCFLEPFKLFLFSVPEEVSLKIEKMTVLSTRESALNNPPPVCSEDKLTPEMIDIIAHQIIWTLPSDERVVYGPCISHAMRYLIEQTVAKLRFGLPQLMAALVLMKRICVSSRQKIAKGIVPVINICNHNIRMTFLGCLLLANKLSDDWAYFNGNWARLFGVDVKVINGIEERVLDALNFDLFISDEAYTECIKAFEKFWTLPQVDSEK